MINEDALWTMLDLLQYYIGVSGDRQDDLWESIADVMADLDTNDTPDSCQDDDYTGTMPMSAYKREEPVSPIPHGVPCWVTNRNGFRYVCVATGERDRYYLRGADFGRSDSAVPGTMRPVCFEKWHELGPHIKAIELVYSRGTWTTRWLTEYEHPSPGNYFERRPRGGRVQ